ncbi:hypothetical protein [Sphingomonas aracearum]|uniref:Uncharacterized protein n=1 Tax=Sphingomonas aracearum TaxID=2283317 RepID=A0A369VUE2_9SPHN|nr:hypothetical protein [Sphingomonas aracearum]RDE05968.1 hypothetical protein DVW87_12365 [Sphingomonas aracearum]
MTNPDDDLLRLRRLDDLLEASNDIDSLRAEIDRAALMVKKAQLREIRAMLDRQADDPVVVPFDRAQAEARLAAMMAESADMPLTLAARGASPDDLDALLDDLVELERSRDTSTD